MWLNSTIGAEFPGGLTRTKVVRPMAGVKKQCSSQTLLELPVPVHVMLCYEFPMLLERVATCLFSRNKETKLSFLIEDILFRS